MLALHWPLDPDLWTLAFGRWSRRTLVAIGAGQFGAHPFSARDGARNPFDQPPTIQQPIRRIVETIVNGFSVKFRSPRLSILATVPDYLADDDPDVFWPAMSFCRRCNRLCPIAVWPFV